MVRLIGRLLSGKVINRRRTHFRYVRLAGTLIALVFSSSSCSVSFPTIPPAELDETRQLCNGIEAPASFTKIRDRQLERPELAIYTTEYSSEDSPEEVLEFFRSILVPRGWQLQVKRKGGTNYLEFERGRNRIVVEYETLAIGDRKYLLSCGWGIS